MVELVCLGGERVELFSKKAEVIERSARALNLRKTVVVAILRSLDVKFYDIGENKIEVEFKFEFHKEQFEKRIILGQALISHMLKRPVDIECTLLKAPPDIELQTLVNKKQAEIDILKNTIKEQATRITYLSNSIVQLQEMLAQQK